MTPEPKSPHLNVAGTLDDAAAWLDRMGERGMLNASSVRLKRNAIAQLSSVLGPEEPRTVEYFESNLDSIAKRWATKESANPETVATYESRARTALRDYLKYLEDPASFKPKSSAARPSTKKSTGASAATKSGKASKEEPSNAEPPMPPKAEPQVAQTELRTFPLGKDRGCLVYSVPEGLTMADVMKITCHLATLADDFDPLKANVFAMTRRGE